VALRARTSDQWGASRKNFKQMLALRAKVSIIGASRKMVRKITRMLRAANARPFLLQSVIFPTILREAPTFV